MALSSRLMADGKVRGVRLAEFRASFSRHDELLLLCARIGFNP